MSMSASNRTVLTWVRQATGGQSHPPPYYMRPHPGLLDVDFWCTGEIEIRTSVDPIYKNTSQIYKGIMACDVGQDILVVCKLTPARYAHQAYREAEFYARELRGAEFVPKTYRFSQVGTGDDIHLCLLMEDCGEPLKQRFYQLGWEMKEALVDVYLQLHRRGIYHEDVDTGNVIIRPDGQLVLINFDESRRERCDHDGIINWHQTKFRDPEDFVCRELNLVCDLVKAYVPYKISCFGHEYQMSEELLKNETVVTWIIDDVSKRTKIHREEVEGRLIKVLKEFQDNLERRMRCEAMKWEADKPLKKKRNVTNT